MHRVMLFLSILVVLGGALTAQVPDYELGVPPVQVVQSWYNGMLRVYILARNSMGYPGTNVMIAYADYDSSTLNFKETEGKSAVLRLVRVK